jgi:hypothetical protein
MTRYVSALRWLVLPLLGLAVLVGARAAQAHGATVRLDDNYGQYHMIVATGAAPQVGDLLVTVVLTGKDNNDGSVPASIVGATVTATFRLKTGAGAPVAIPIPPEPTLADQGYYERILTVPGEGDWNVTVDVTSPLGLASAAFPVTFRRPPPGTEWLTWGAVALPIVIAIGAFIYIWRGPRRARAAATGEDDLLDEDDDPEDDDAALAEQA